MSVRLTAMLGQFLGRRPDALQIGALCIDPASARILLITSRGTGRWIIPKGWPMPGRTLGEAAMQEAWEEGGVRGAVSAEPIGRYEYAKRQPRGFDLPIEVEVFVQRIDSLESDYPEAGQRQRRLFTPERAAELVAEPGLSKLILRMGRDGRGGLRPPR